MDQMELDQAKIDRVPSDMGQACPIVVFRVPAGVLAESEEFVVKNREAGWANIYGPLQDIIGRYLNDADHQHFALAGQRRYKGDLSGISNAFIPKDPEDENDLGPAWNFCIEAHWTENESNGDRAGDVAVFLFRYVGLWGSENAKKAERHKTR